ncbi:SMP-30/gluconolactonase/LRE family protein [Thermomonospora amylolytica]|uniref:SMP-30/gluconolactonase/LRE family protein n=1 Tax=Thermomonospora amylolytica TaxID=1411117 RepID=UPI0013005ED1|nr:SMP-30/gluconolactonase/LRE family protein [Thermomonospora amylolytica]
MHSIVSRRSVMAGLAALALAAVPAAPASATATGTAWPEVVTGHAPSLHPEGIAYDPTRRAFLVGSMRHGTVSVVRPDGTVRTLVNDPALISSVGIKVDARNGRLLVANSDIGLSVHSAPATTERTAGLGVYDLRTGRRIRYVDLADVAADGARHMANDIAVAPDGTAYVTDSFAPVVYRVPLRGPARVHVRDSALATDGFGGNGIVWRAGGLIVGKYDDGTLWRVSSSGLRRITLPRPLRGADGLAVRPDGALAVVINPLSAGGDSTLVTVRLTRGGTRAVIVGEQPSPEYAPSTAAIGPDGRPYVISGQMDVLLGGSTSDTFTIRRF